MEFWSTQMPKGMLLRSPWSGSNISDPQKLFTLDRYEPPAGSTVNTRVPLQDFVRYGQWFQQQALPDLDRRNIARLEFAGNGYRMTLEDGESLHARNVVIATGIGSFANRPQPFQSLPTELASHTSDRSNSDLGRFSGKRVAVVGAGQSAIESAALLEEAGAEVEVLIRQPQLRWLKTRQFVEWLMEAKYYPFKAPGKIGPLGLNWLLEHPALFTLPSRKMQDTMAYRAIRPAASGWLKPRIKRSVLTTGRHSVSAEDRNGRVHVRLDDGTNREFDHVLLGTGYKIDISRYGFLSPDLLRGLHTVRGYPILNRGFESSHPGLYFAGATAAYSFGPFFRFVAGSGYAASTLSRYAVPSQKRRVNSTYREQPVEADAA
jgi:cation diffusion facilitator CzcD-associated flavoprotein CzcO